MSSDDELPGAPSAEGEPTDPNDPALDTRPDDHPYRQVRPLEYVIAMVTWLAVSFVAATLANRWSHVDPRSWSAQLIAAPSIASLVASFTIVRRHLPRPWLIAANVAAAVLAFVIAFFVRTA